MKKNLKTILIYIGGILFCLFQAFLYIWGDISIYITSYYKNKYNQSISPAVSTFSFLIIQISFTIGSAFSNFIYNGLGIRLCLIVNGLLFCISVLCASFAQNFYLLLFLFVFCSSMSGIITFTILYVLFFFLSKSLWEIYGSC